MIGTKIKKRSDKVAFLGIPDSLGDISAYHRMKGFSTLSHAKNSKEYNRQYVDEDFEESDVVGYSPSYEFGFDRYEGNQVHEYLADIFDKELVGNSAVVTVIVVDMDSSGTGQGSKKAIKRDYAVIPSSEGDSTDAYTYSGSFKSKSDREEIEVVTTDGWNTLTVYTPPETPPETEEGETL